MDEVRGACALSLRLKRIKILALGEKLFWKGIDKKKRTRNMQCLFNTLAKEIYYSNEVG